MKDAQKEFKMNIQKHELTELGGTQSLSFLFSMISWFNSVFTSRPVQMCIIVCYDSRTMVNKDVLPTKLPIPLYEEM